MVERMLSQAKAEEPELPNARPRKDAPSFVSLSSDRQLGFLDCKSFYNLRFGRCGFQRLWVEPWHIPQIAYARPQSTHW